MIALQASTAQNDLVVASFLVAAVALLLDTGRGAPWLAGGATALAVGTKVTAVFGIPILLVVAFLAASTRRGQRLTGVARRRGGGRVLVRRQLGRGGELGRRVSRTRTSSPGSPRRVARGLRSAIQLVELPGAVGSRPMALPRRRRRSSSPVSRSRTGAGARPRRSVSAAGAALLAALPVLTPDVRRYLDEAYLELWRAVGRDDLAVTVGRDITRSASNVTWYGPLGALLRRRRASSSR